MTWLRVGRSRVRIPEIEILMVLTTHLGLELGLRMNGAISLFTLYAFMVWTGTTLALPFIHF